MITVTSKITRRLKSGEEPMFWVDIETTGLDPQKEDILEIGLRVTNQNLLELARYTSLVNRESSLYKLANAVQIVQDMHQASGLTAAITQLADSEIRYSLTPDMVADDALDFLVDFLEGVPLDGMPPMCGNSVHFDRAFLAAQMPGLHEFFHYRDGDVSSIKEFCSRFNPRVFGYLKAEQAGWERVHRPQEDLDASIRELKFYMTEFLMIDDSINLDDEHDPAQLPLF